MMDVVYVLGSIGYFALMLAFLAGCERLGRSRGEEGTKS